MRERDGRGLIASLAGLTAPCPQPQPAPGHGHLGTQSTGVHRGGLQKQIWNLPLWICLAGWPFLPLPSVWQAPYFWNCPVNIFELQLTMNNWNCKNLNHGKGGTTVTESFALAYYACTRMPGTSCWKRNWSIWLVFPLIHLIVVTSLGLVEKIMIAPLILFFFFLTI